MDVSYDEAIWTEERKILTGEQLMVPGMEMFGYNCSAEELYVLSPHIHKTAEFLYVANGSQRYYIEDTAYEPKGDQVLVVDAGQVHSTGSSPYGRYENLWFRLDLEVFAEALSLPEASKARLCTSLSHMAYPIITVKKRWYRDMKQAFFDLATEDPVRRLCGYATVVRFVAELVKCTEVTPRYSEDICRVLSHIEENTHLWLSLEQLAALAGLSLSGFKQKFKRETGITPREYINLSKIRKAKEWLLQDRSVTDVAFALDFCNSSHFSYTFRRIEGISPTEYIRRNGGKR